MTHQAHLVQQSKDITTLLIELEAKLDKNLFEPEQAPGIRFCVSQIILKAIALTKDPKVETPRIKDMYDLALEILAHGDLKTEPEEKRLTDLINAMVEKEDINLIIKSLKIENKLQFESLNDKQNFQHNLIKEQLLENAAKVEGLAKSVNRLNLKSSTLHIFLVTLVTLATLLFTIVTAGAIIAYLLTSSQQPDFTKKESFFQKESFQNSQFAGTIYQPIKDSSNYKNIIIMTNSP